MNEQAFDEHAIWATLDSLKQILSEDLTGETDEHRDEVRLAHSVVQYIDALRGADPRLVDEGTLTAIGNSLTQARERLNAYMQDREANATTLTNGVVPALISARDAAIQKMPAPAGDDVTRAAQDATERYRRAADAEITSLRERIEGLQTELADLDQQRKADAEDAQQQLSQLQQKITQGDQQVATQTTQLQEQIETQRASFTEEAEQREAAFKASEVERETVAGQQRDEQAGRAESLITQLQDSREQARNLLDATNRDVVSGDYQGWASKQGKAALSWTVTTVVIGLITVGALVWVVLGAQNDSVQFLIAKSSVGLIGLIVAGYAARQAAEHRTEERTAKRLALDLAALEPFLEHVENPEELRTEIAKRVFVPEPKTGADGRFALGRRAVSVAELTELLKVIFQKPPL